MDNATAKEVLIGANVNPELAAYLGRVARACGVSRAVLIRRALRYTLPLIERGVIPVIEAPAGAGSLAEPELAATEGGR